MKKTRCRWAPEDKIFYRDYHDTEWGVPVHEDRILFEMLILEGAQAGLSWETILKRRDGYRKAFKKFDPRKVAALLDALPALSDAERKSADPALYLALSASVLQQHYRL